MVDKKSNVEAICEECKKVILDGERYFAETISVEYEENNEIFTDEAIMQKTLCLVCAKKLNELEDFVGEW